MDLDFIKLGLFANKGEDAFMIVNLLNTEKCYVEFNKEQISELIKLLIQYISETIVQIEVEEENPITSQSFKYTKNVFLYTQIVNKTLTYRYKKKRDVKFEKKSDINKVSYILSKIIYIYYQNEHKIKK